MTPRKETNRIMWHCTATPAGREVTYDDLCQWHIKDNGWSHIGYHYLIQLDGTEVECRPEELQGAGCSGQNHDTIHIAYAGGMTYDMREAKDTRTPEQKGAMDALTEKLCIKYRLGPEAIVGHNQYAAKACPCFDVPAYVAKTIDVDGEYGDPERGMPSLGPIGLVISELLQLMKTDNRVPQRWELISQLEDRINALDNRIAALEEWARKGGDL